MSSLKLIIFVLIAICPIGQLVISAKVDNLRDQSEFILTRFFSLSQMACKHPTQDDMKKYNKTIISMMDEAYSRSKIDVEYAIKQVNSEIYKIELNKPSGSDDEKLQNAIDLMLPDFIKSKDFADARKDLRVFYDEDKTQSKDLLDKLKVKLDKTDLSTRHLAQMMQNYYYHWIPLARLAKVLGPK